MAKKTPSLPPEEQAEFDTTHQRWALEHARQCGQAGTEITFADPELQAEYLRAREAA